jgi:hypothetical protein
MSAGPGEWIRAACRIAVASISLDFSNTGAAGTSNAQSLRKTADSDRRTRGYRTST